MSKQKELEDIASFWRAGKGSILSAERDIRILLEEADIVADFRKTFEAFHKDPNSMSHTDVANAVLDFSDKWGLFRRG